MKKLLKYLSRVAREALQRGVLLDQRAQLGLREDVVVEGAGDGVGLVAELGDLPEQGQVVFTEIAELDQLRPAPVGDAHERPAGLDRRGIDADRRTHRSAVTVPVGQLAGDAVLRFDVRHRSSG